MASSFTPRRHGRQESNNLSTVLPPLPEQRRSSEADAAALVGKGSPTAKGSSTARHIQWIRQASSGSTGTASDAGFGRQISDSGFGRQISDSGFSRQTSDGGFSRQVSVLSETAAVVTTARRSLPTDGAPASAEPRLPDIVRRVQAIRRTKKDRERFPSAPAQLSSLAVVRNEPAALDTLDSIRALLHSSTHEAHEADDAASEPSLTEDEAVSPGSFESCVAEMRRKMHFIRQFSSEEAVKDGNLTEVSEVGFDALMSGRDIDYGESLANVLIDGEYI